MNKKGNFILGLVVVVVVIIVLGLVLANIAKRECKDNTDCSEDSYCGSNYKCNSYPDEIVIKETVKERTFLPASIVIAVALIISAYILRKKIIK